MKRNATVLFLALLYCAALLAAVGASWYLSGCPRTGIDDACIFLSYARNIAQGNGFVYGGFPEHVEGCTSLLWTLVCAACVYFKAGNFGIFAISFLCTAGAHLIWMRMMLRQMPDNPVMRLFSLALFVGFMLSSPAHLGWTTYTLMDVGLYALCMAIVSDFVCFPGKFGKKRLVFMVFCFALFPLARPEFMMIGPAALAVYALSGLVWKNASFSWKVLFACALALVLSTLALTAFRMTYFGFPFPNTYYAKVSPSLGYNLLTGGRYLLRLVAMGPATWALLAVTLAAVLIRGIGKRSAAGLPALWFLVLVAPPILTGGDHFCYCRFYQPLYPFLPVVIAAVLAAVWAAFAEDAAAKARGDGLCASGRRALTVFAGLVAGGVFALQPSWRIFGKFNELDKEFEHARAGIMEGRQLSKTFSGMVRRPVLGVITAGGVALGYDGPIVDLMGLNNVKIAHHGGDRKGVKNHAAFAPELFPELGVDVLLVRGEWQEGLLKNLPSEDWFVKNWRRGSFFGTEDGGSTDQVFASNVFIGLAERSGLRFVDVGGRNAEAQNR